ncbi:MAG: replication initiator protein [Microvirus sp.]|nr:MAG: replication initiator protein [Microvirus sp.]
MSIPRPNGNGATDRVVIPCGKCMACLQKKRNEWAFRLKQELKLSCNAYFVTLTYEDDKLPFLNYRTGKFFPKGYIPAEPFSISLDKSEIQRFLKRLRHDLTVRDSIYPFKYFIVGEYGSITNRPHYHALLFNVRTNEPITIENLLLKHWKNGHIHIGTVSDRSISYTAKYVINKAEKLENQNSGFAIMSKRPAIGANYINTHSDYHKKNQAFYGTDQGKKVGLPRYYRDRIFNSEQIKENLEKVQKIIDEKEIEELEKFRLKGENLYYAQLMQKIQSESSSKNKSKKNSKL